MEWNGMKRIILEYSSLPFFESFNGGNGKLIPLLGGNAISRREYSFPSIPLKSQIFIPPEIERNGRELN